MKLKEFDFKLPKEEKRRKKIIITSISVIAIILIITLASTFAYYQSIENQNPINTSVGEFSSGDVIFAVTIDGNSSQTFPTKGSGYISSSVTCDKSATGIWDNSEWTITVSNLTQSKTTCDINFITIPTLKDTILAQFGGENAVEEAPVETFASISQPTDKLMYKMEDDYGWSYYYRGAKSLLNNNLVFAGFQWKIIRINGDNSVRIIYNGICPNNECTINNTGVSTLVRFSQFNVAAGSGGSDTKVVGYMFGGTSTASSTSRAQAVANQTSSEAKQGVDNWYATNIANKNADIVSKISDVVFCNDRHIYYGSGYGDPMFGIVETTRYIPYERLVTSGIPTLKCIDKNDRFTVSDTTVGNGALTNPVGLISADEVVVAGGKPSSANSTYYLYINQDFWTMTPLGTNAIVPVLLDGSINLNRSSTNGYGIRPVLNLISEVPVLSGDGSASNPFKVV